MGEVAVEHRKCPERTYDDREAGFTLVELLVVLVILGLIVGLAAPQVMKYVGTSKTKAATMQVERLSSILDLFRLDVGRYPSVEEGLEGLLKAPALTPSWNGPYLKKADALVDPWGRAYEYRYPGKNGTFDLFSLGADGKEGGDGEDQDVTSW
ncbi:type II secretion system major pseudopilin GspG [Rhodoligotrophos defluvii]|uniref:type II secretion system major pseudopilin GspG n=1 Tax=Rhodoligotrophos defluvii TaxID=2561934 RepID=UPI0010C9F849|nr:type II secretion system major pseudopilin GspG [Rhodoligotrophos defluvii]